MFPTIIFIYSFTELDRFSHAIFLVRNDVSWNTVLATFLVFRMSGIRCPLFKLLSAQPDATFPQEALASDDVASI